MMCEIRSLYMTLSTGMLGAVHMKVTRSSLPWAVRMLSRNAELENLGY